MFSYAFHGVHRDNFAYMLPSLKRRFWPIRITHITGANLTRSRERVEKDCSL